MKSNRIRESSTDRAFFIIVWAVMIFSLLATVYPLYFVVIASISDPSQVAMGEIVLFPKNLQLDGYRKVFQSNNIWNAYWNTIIYTSAGTLINVVSTMTAAFVFSRKNLKGSRLCMLVILFTMFFSGGLIPTYFNIRNLGMLDTIWALIIPGAVSVYNLIIARTYIQSNVPVVLEEASGIDGCTPLRFYLRVVLPLSAPIIGVLTLYCVVGYWNSYYDALIYLTNRSKYPLQLILREILIQSKISAEDMNITDKIKEGLRSAQLAESLKYALIIVSSLPMLILYPFLQRFFVKGIMVGSIKG